MTLRNVQKGILAACAGLAASAAVWTSHAQEAPTPQDEPALATYEGGRILRSELQRVIAERPAIVRWQIDQEPEAKRALLEQMIDYELLLKEAERRGYADHPNVKLAMRKAAIDALIEGPLAVAPESVSAADIDAAYAARSSELNKPEQRRARHVVLATEAEAKALLMELRKAGERAYELITKTARERSVDQATKRQSGELGFFAASGERVNGDGRIAPELAAAAFKLRKNRELAKKPIPTAGGFSVLMLIDIVEPSSVPRDQAAGMIAEQIAEQRSDAAVDALVEELKKAHAVETFPERADAVALDPSKRGDIPQGFPAAPADPTAPLAIQEPDGI